MNPMTRLRERLVFWERLEDGEEPDPIVGEVLPRVRRTSAEPQPLYRITRIRVWDDPRRGFLTGKVYRYLVRYYGVRQH